ncbi:MAG: hypothetical protein H7338_17140 [Candidatus Sericytochromatia bacterium]|nr:hypothetical protein [Candidatus Sericytochromatia bacterium]
MRKLLLSLGFVATMLGTASSAAFAATANGELVFTNGTATAFTDVFICKSNANDWGDAIFHDEISPGETVKANFTGFGQDVCSFSIRVIDSNGTKWDVDEIDMCETTKVTFKNEGGKMKYYAE